MPFTKREREEEKVKTFFVSFFEVRNCCAIKA